MAVTKKFDGMTNIYLVCCDTAEELVNELNVAYSLAGGTQTLFRGQNSDDPTWTLLPKAMRRNFQECFVTPTYEQFRHHVVQNQASLSAELDAKGEKNLRLYVQKRYEEYIVRQFARIADEARLYVPTDQHLALGGEHQEIEEQEILDAIHGEW